MASLKTLLNTVLHAYVVNFLIDFFSPGRKETEFCCPCAERKGNPQAIYGE